jgi:hypothetical protein
MKVGFRCTAAVPSVGHVGRIGLIVSAIIMASAARAQPSQPPAFTATPISGRAPLTVKFCATAGIGIDFGDGTSSGMGMAQRGDCPAGVNSYATHTYVTAGIYQLRGFPCPGVNAASCGAVAAQASAIRITVTAP